MESNVSISGMLMCLAGALAAPAHADIYKCKDEHGNVAYLQTPCPVQEHDETPVTDDEDTRPASAARDGETSASSSEPQSVEIQVSSSRRPGETLNECKKRYRDQIDEIDAEMRRAFSPEQGAAYKDKLLALTRQLRGCG